MKGGTAGGNAIRNPLKPVRLSRRNQPQSADQLGGRGDLTTLPPRLHEPLMG